MHQRSAHWLCGAIAAVGLAASAGASELHVANSGEPDTLDPHHASGVWENRIIGDMFMGLTTEAADGSVIPGAAESWEVSDDGLLYTFTLREHTWSDGTPVTADDFVFAMQRLVAPETAAKYASLLYTVDNAQAINEGALDPGELGVRALDDGRLEIALEYPAPYFIEQLTHYTAFPVPRHKVEELGDDWVKPANLVSNGAYTAGAWVPNTEVHLVKNDAFYDADNVAIEDVYYYPSEERNAGTKRFRAGEVDIQYGFASEQIAWLEENLPEATRIAPYLGIYYYAINTRNAPLSDPDVRNALAMAIDRKAITDQVLKTGEIPAYSFVPPDTGSYGEPTMAAWQEVPHDERVPIARELLKAAGFGPDQPLQLQLRYNTSETHKKVAIAVAAMWKQFLGVDTELFNSEVKVHYNDVQQGNFEVARAGWIADYNDPQNFLYLMESDTGVLNYAGYANEAYDRLMNQADTTTDQAERNELMHQAEAIAMQDMPNIPIYYYVSKNLVDPAIEGYVDNTKDIHRTRWMTIPE